jgi:hypothetical protein
VYKSHAALFCDGKGGLGQGQGRAGLVRVLHHHHFGCVREHERGAEGACCGLAEGQLEDSKADDDGRRRRRRLCHGPI